MSGRTFRKNIISRGASYLLMVPFIPAIRPLLRKSSIVDLAVFIAGFLLTLILIIISNHKPYIRISGENLFIYLLYKHKPEIHNLNSIESAEVNSPRQLTLKTVGFAPLDVRLGRREMAKLIEVLEKEGVPVSRAGNNL